VSVATGPTTTTNYSGADWYPSSGEPDSPLVLQETSYAYSLLTGELTSTTTATTTLLNAINY
jgi:hypothetical protein